MINYMWEKTLIIQTVFKSDGESVERDKSKCNLCHPARVRNSSSSSSSPRSLAHRSRPNLRPPFRRHSGHFSGSDLTPFQTLNHTLGGMLISVSEWGILDPGASCTLILNV
ncbi:unnamed protein product [Citrullus colocynthis]|uniref:Uncharacterized protein n=1 Tax=Citrullus colocynthis TaxID=252529 RepID=A0ABP0XNL0_9ROSI